MRNNTYCTEVKLPVISTMVTLLIVIIPVTEDVDYRRAITSYVCV